MLVEGHLVEWLLLAKCVTLLKYCVNKNKKQDTFKTIASDNKANSHFHIRWPPASLTLNNYFLPIFYFYI